MFNLSHDKRKANKNGDSILHLLDQKKNKFHETLSVGKATGKQARLHIVSGV